MIYTLRRTFCTITILALGLLTASSVPARERLGLRHEAIDLPGPPAKVIPIDLDGDGRQDLVVVLAYTFIEEQGEHRIQEMVQITTVIPFLFDRREVRAYLAASDGTYSLAGTPLELPASVLHMEAGPPGLGIIALTDDGLSRLRFEPGGDGSPLHLEPLVEDPPFLARTRSFYASLELVHDLDGDGRGDVLLPSREGLAVYLSTDSGLEAAPAHRVEVKERDRSYEGEVGSSYPWPVIRDISGDGLADLLFTRTPGERGYGNVHVLLGAGGGRFRPLREEPLDCHDRLTDLRMAVGEPDLKPWPSNLSAVRDLDGDGRAEAVYAVEESRGDGMRKELKDAKQPIQSYRFHHLNEDLNIDLEPYYQRQVIGHTMVGSPDAEEIEPFWIEQFQDLDGDGREDLVTLTLEFSVFQAVKILATKKIGLGINFHVYHQEADGSFVEVPDLDLSEKLRFDLNNLKVGRFAQFAGDFDGDGRVDFVHLGRGKVVTLHTGQPGCRYPKNADLSIRLEEEPVSLDLIRVEDLDGDGRSDLRIIRPLVDDDPDVTSPVRLDLYLSGEGS